MGAHRLCFCCAALTAACGLDTSYTGLGQGAIPDDPLYPNDPSNCSNPDAGSSDPGTLNVDDLSGRAYRFDQLVFTSPLSGFLGDTLNAYFQDELDKGSINIVLVVDNDDRDKASLSWKVGAAEQQGDGYRFTEGFTELLCSLEGASFETDTPGALDFPNDLLEPPLLPIQSLRLSGKFFPDASRIKQGVFDGALSEDDARSIVLMGSDLHTTLSGMNLPLDADTNGDGTPDAWRFLGTFTAAQVTYSP